MQQVRALRLFISAAPGVAVLATFFVLAEAFLPNLVIIAMGHVTGSIPGAVEHGLSSSDGQNLIAALAIASGIYALSLLRGPLDDALSAAVGARMQAVLQRRVIDAVSAPVGIAHLEDQEVLDQLESATGQLRGDQLADAPMTLLGLWGDRLGGALSCVVVATFRWWAGLLLFAVWVLVRFPARAFVVSRVSTFRRATAALRHATYLFGLATRAAPAKEVRVFGLVDWTLDRHQEDWHRAMDPSWGELHRIDRRLLAVSLPVLGAYLACGAALGHAAYTHEIGLRTLATMLPMLPMSMQLGSITMTDVSLESMLSGLPDLDALTAQLDNDQQLGGEPVPAGAPERSVVLDGVRFRYPGGEEDVLRGIDLELPAGTSLALVGVNGAGKSTLVSLLARLHDPTAGQILVDGRPLSTLDAEAWRERIAIVYQEALWLPLTARENVAIEALTGAAADEDALAHAARQAGATELIEALPAGWDTILSPQYAGGVDLSGGQWQRIALARALYAVARGARVLVLDEPTAQLDVRAEAAFYARFLELTEGTTSVVISHRFSTVRRADRIAVLDGGVITELGTHAELVQANGTYAEMFRIQAEAYSRVRRLWELVALGFRAAPGLSASVSILGALGALASVSYTLGFRITIDAVGAHDAHRIAFGVILIAVLFTFAWLATILSASRGSVLTDKVNLYLGVRIGKLAGSLPGLEHFERPADLAQIDQLRTNRRALAAAPRRMLGIFQVGLRSLAIVVLLATIYPPILLVPVFALAPFLANRRATALQQRADDTLAEPRRLLGELFAIATNPQGARELRTYGATGAVAERHAALGDEIRRRALRAQLVASAWEAAGWLVFAAAFAAAVLALVLRAAHGHASPGGVVMAVSLMRRAQTQVTRGADGAVSLGATLRTADQLRWLEEQAAEPATRVTDVVPSRLTDGITLRDVAFAYPSGGRDVLDGVDLHLPAGSIVALLGDNGAGKTTLVKLLTGMYQPTAGAIELDGVGLHDVALDRWRERTTATFQDYERLQFVVQQSIGVGDLPRIDDADAARAALKRAGGETLLDALPQGLATPLGRTLARGRELSGGQWQRIALARGLMRRDPLLVILDEPTASVDAPTERALFERYAAAARAAGEAHGAVSLLISHRFSTARVADLIVLIEHGRIVETGAHEELVAAGGAYAELYELQASAYRD